MGVCHFCDEVVGEVNMNVPKHLETDKEEMKMIHVLAKLRSHSMVCEYCYLEKFAAITTAMRIKAENQNRR